MNFDDGAKQSILAPHKQMFAPVCWIRKGWISIRDGARTRRSIAYLNDIEPVAQEAEGAIWEHLGSKPPDRSVADRSVEGVWDEEVARRINDLKAGRAVTVPWEKLHREVLAMVISSRK